MSSDSILDRIDNMLGKKKKEEITIEPSSYITKQEYIELLNIVSRNIKDQSTQIDELKTAILINSNKQSENIKELNKIIKDISLPLTTTKVINASNIKAKNIYTIIKKIGTGKIREVIILTKSNFNLYIKSDSTELFNLYSFNDLIEISDMSNNISTKVNKEIKTLAIKDISFNKSIEISINSDDTIDIYKMYCIYDIK